MEREKTHTEGRLRYTSGTESDSSNTIFGSFDKTVLSFLIDKGSKYTTKMTMHIISTCWILIGTT